MRHSKGLCTLFYSYTKGWKKYRLFAHHHNLAKSTQNAQETGVKVANSRGIAHTIL